MVNQALKKNKLIVSIHRNLINTRNNIISRISPSTLSKMRFKKFEHKKINLKNPKLFNEKLIYIQLKDYNNNLLVSKCADKYEVREYIKEKGCKEILNDIYGVYEDANDIDWNKLPDKFVLKCTHGCGFNIICTNKNELNKEETIKKLNRWKKKKFGYQTAEIHYTRIKPRIIAERYLETDAGELPNDYKLLCFNGVPKIVQVCSEREENVKFDFFDFNWNKLDIVKDEYKNPKIPQKPENLDKMIEYAKVLSEDFKFVRVDFYDDNGKVILGEMTFTPGGNLSPFYSDKGNKLLGEMLEI